MRDCQRFARRLAGASGKLTPALPGLLAAWALALAPLEAAAQASSNAQPANASVIRVALYRGPGTGGKGPPSLMKKLNAPGVSTIAEVTPEQIRGGALTNYDVVIFGGGSGSKQAEAIGDTGRDAVRQFVGGGGGYIGICAGAYLATSGFTWSLRLINAQTVSPKWKRGVGDVKLELTDFGTKLLGARDGLFDVRYANGPVVQPANLKELPAYQSLATFRSEFASNGAPAGVMVNSPALFAADYRQGRVVCISPHPEQTRGLEEFVPRALVWVAPSAKRKSQ